MITINFARSTIIYVQIHEISIQSHSLLSEKKNLNCHMSMIASSSSMFWAIVAKAVNELRICPKKLVGNARDVHVHEVKA